MRNSWRYLGLAAIVPAMGLCGCAAAASHHDPEGSAESGGDDGDSDDLYGGSIEPGSGAPSAVPAANTEDGRVSAVMPKSVRVSAAGSMQPGSGKGSSGNSNNGGSSSASAPANDTCSGAQVVSLTLDAGPQQVDGTLTDASDDLTTFCADTTGAADKPDVTYEIHVPERASVSFHLESQSFDPALSLRKKACLHELSGDACLNYGASVEQTKMELAAGTYWIVVDSADGSAGDFTLTLTATTPACGDGVLNTGEQCDPGAGEADDGCYDPGTGSECSFGEAPSSADITQCGGYGPVSVSLSADPGNPDIVRLGPYNNGAGGHSEENDITQDMYVCGWAASGPENVFHVAPQSSGTLHARIGYDDQANVMCDLVPNCGDFILYMRKAQCEPVTPADPDQQMACVDFDPGAQEILTISAPVDSGSDYWVFVDGLDDVYGIGPYYLELWLTN